MLLCAQYVLPITSEPIHNGAVLVRDGAIRDVGDAAMLKLRYPDEEVSDFGQAAILPGFVDLHTHLENAVMRGIVHDVPYATWIMTMRELSAKMDVDDWYDSAILGGLESLSSGITTVADITTSGASCTATAEAGHARRRLSRGGRHGPPSRGLRHAPGRERPGTLAGRGRLRPPDHRPCAVVAVHLQPGDLPARSLSSPPRRTFPWRCAWPATARSAHFVRYGSSPFSVHSMDTTRCYVEVPPWLPTGTTPVNYVLNWGAFESDNVMMVHGVYVDDHDVAKLREYDVSVASCPRINAQLGMGVAPLAEFLNNGLRVGLGTDSPAATDSTDMISEMHTGMLIQRAVNPRNFMKSSTMLEMATIGGARALRMDDKIGSLEVGKLADVIAVDLSGSHQTPATDPVSAVVNACTGSDVLMTMVGGNVLYEKSSWHVGVEVARSIARVIEIRGKLR